MKGTELKKVLTDGGYVLKDVASLMGMTQPNFSQLMKVQDVKTGTLEQMCQVLNKKMDFFYANTPYAPVNAEASHNSDELALLRGQIMAYQDALDRIGRGEASFIKEKANAG